MILSRCYYKSSLGDPSRKIIQGVGEKELLTAIKKEIIGLNFINIVAIELLNLLKFRNISQKHNSQNEDNRMMTNE